MDGHFQPFSRNAVIPARDPRIFRVTLALELLTALKKLDVHL